MIPYYGHKTNFLTVGLVDLPASNKELTDFE